MTKVASYLVALALLLTACGSDDKGSGTTTPVGEETPTSSPATPVAPSIPMPTGKVKRTDAQLTKALLELKDMPDGFQEDEGRPERDKYEFSSPKSSCKRLVRYLNADKPPGSQATARRSFTGGQQGPFMDFTLDSQGTVAEVAEFRGAYEDAVDSCEKVTLRVAGQGSSPMEVRKIPAPQQGIDPFAVKLTGTSGPLEGREFSTALTSLGDVVLVVGVVAGQEGELEAATEAAATKALQLLVPAR